MLATSKYVLFPGHNHLLNTLIIVLGHQHRWLAGSYDLEIGHALRWLAWWLPDG